jgi:hypothetical protein
MDTGWADVAGMKFLPLIWAGLVRKPARMPLVAALRA